VRGLLTTILIALSLPPPILGADAPSYKIAFAERPAGDPNWYISVMNPDGTGRKRICPANPFSLSWSPDGERIAFVSAYDIFIINADGTGRRNITNTPNTKECDLDWSPDGRRIVFSTIQKGIWLLDLRTGVRKRISSQKVKGPCAPVWSPDGRKIAFYANMDGWWDIFICDEDGGNIVNLTNDLSPDGIPVFTPDGKGVLFLSSRKGDRTGIFLVDIETRRVKEIFVPPVPKTVMQIVDLDISPDGGRIFFPVYLFQKASYDICSVDLSTGDLINITDTPFISEVKPRCSPSRGAFVSPARHLPTIWGAMKRRW